MHFKFTQIPNYQRNFALYGTRHVCTDNRLHCFSLQFYQTDTVWFQSVPLNFGECSSQYHSSLASTAQVWWVPLKSHGYYLSWACNFSTRLFNSRFSFKSSPFSCTSLWFSVSRNPALIIIWFSLARLASRDLLAATLFLFLLLQYFSSLLSSGTNCCSKER